MPFILNTKEMIPNTSQLLGGILAMVFLPFLIQERIGFAGMICGFPETGKVAITRSDKVIQTFSVTQAASKESQRKGLMHCPFLHPGTGMLFTFPDARQRTFWMKNTLIELAIVFISAEGRIVAIERGRPGSRSRIRSPEKIQSVLEINFRESVRLAIGDSVQLGLDAGVSDSNTWP
ncbi:MAG: DUF192 domain-containing protein [Desulfosarcina sp.]|jgi:hypothetical protein